MPSGLPEPVTGRTKQSDPGRQAPVLSLRIAEEIAGIPSVTAAYRTDR